MIGRLHRWGNSFAIRVPKKEVDRLGLGEGSAVDVSLRPATLEGRVDLSDRPTYRDPDTNLSLKVDQILYGED